MNDFELFHAYRRLVRAGKAAPLACEFCNTELETRLGKDDELNLWCYTCDSWILPGWTTIARVKYAVSGEL